MLQCRTNQPTNVTFLRMQVFDSGVLTLVCSYHLTVVFQIGFHGLVQPFLYLGCLGVATSSIPSVSNSPFYERFQQRPGEDSHGDFNALVDPSVLEKFHSSAVYCASELFRLLRDMALDTVNDRSPSLYPAGEVKKSLHLSEIVHPGAVVAIIDLLPAVETSPVFRQKDGSIGDEADGEAGDLQLNLEEERMCEEVSGWTGK